MDYRVRCALVEKELGVAQSQLSTLTGYQEKCGLMEKELGILEG